MMRRISGTMILLLLLVTFHRISTQGTGESGDWSFCKGSCTLGQGDCDRDTDCIGNLFCGQNNCRLFHSQAHPWADCCMKPGCTIKDNYVIPAGNNAPGGQGISSNGPKDCNDKCVRNNQCVAWTLKKDTNLCWLKTVTNFIGGHNEWISGTKCDGCTIQDNYVIPAGNNAPGGWDIPSNGPKDCNDKCVRNNKCVAWTLKKDTNRCWLKTVKNMRAENGYISGTKCDGSSN